MAALAAQVANGWGCGVLEERLRYLLDYAQAFDDASEWFDSPRSGPGGASDFGVEDTRSSGRVRSVSDGCPAQMDPRPAAA